MPQYISLAQQGFWEPFQYLGNAVARNNALALQRQQYEAENAARTRGLDIDAAQLEEQKKTNALNRDIYEVNLKGQKRKEAQEAKQFFLESHDPTADVGSKLQTLSKGKGFNFELPLVEVPFTKESVKYGLNPKFFDLKYVTEDFLKDRETQPGTFWVPFKKELTYEQQPESVQQAIVESYRNAAAAQGLTITPADAIRAYRMQQVLTKPPVDTSNLRPAEMEEVDSAGRKIRFEAKPEPLVEKPIPTSDGSPSMFVQVGKEVRPRPEVTSAKLTEGDKALHVNTAELRQNLNELKNVVQDWGNREMGWPGILSSSTPGEKSKVTSNEAAALLKSLAYRAAIGYSKVVDPATAAREGEVAAATKYAIPMGWTTPNAVTLAAIDSMLAELDRREVENAELRAQQGLPPVSLSKPVAAPTGSETPKFDSLQQAEAAAKAANWSKGTKMLIFDAKSGRYRSAEVK